MKTLKRVCSLKTKQLRWTYDGKVLLKTHEVATIGRQNKLQQFYKGQHLTVKVPGMINRDEDTTLRLNLIEQNVHSSKNL